MKSNDLVFEALLKACNHSKLSLDPKLLRKVYNVQMKHQFEKDREIPLREMSHLIEDYIKKKDI